MTNKQAKKWERYGPILDVVIHHLREGRDRDAVGVIDAIPDEEVRASPISPACTSRRA
jgi:hypothetical protein